MLELSTFISAASGKVETFLRGSSHSCFVLSLTVSAAVGHAQNRGCCLYRSARVKNRKVGATRREKEGLRQAEGERSLLRASDFWRSLNGRLTRRSPLNGTEPLCSVPFKTVHRVSLLNGQLVMQILNIFEVPSWSKTLTLVLDASEANLCVGAFGTLVPTRLNAVLDAQQDPSKCFLNEMRKSRVSFPPPPLQQHVVLSVRTGSDVAWRLQQRRVGWRAPEGLPHYREHTRHPFLTSLTPCP